MSLTSELRNENSPLSKWFLEKASYIGYILVQKHNNHLAKQTIIKPVDGTNFAKVGHAVTYFLRKYLHTLKRTSKMVLATDTRESLLLERPETDWLKDTVAAWAIAKLKIDASYIYVTSQSIEEEAFKMLLLAQLEEFSRTGGISNLLRISGVDTGNRKLLKPQSVNQNSEIRATILDIAQIIKTIPESWENLGFVPEEIKSNVTFPLSSRLKGADCQIITYSNNNTCNFLVDIRTSAKREPCDLNNLYQQVAYFLLDEHNQHKISQLLWYYPRQQCILTYSTYELFTDVNKIRREFNRFIRQNY
ncbi:MAG TPA: hypothetical protein VK203_27775 [Nostocaceae cyanobacterium]|nr:hypothetical protein [Nostocaceae cyanobacterium]